MSAEDDMAWPAGETYIKPDRGEPMTADLTADHPMSRWHHEEGTTPSNWRCVPLVDAVLAARPSDDHDKMCAGPTCNPKEGPTYAACRCCCHAARPSDDLTGLREALYKVAGSITDARVTELMRAASIPLHGHPIHNEAGYVAGLIRAEIKIGVDAALAALAAEGSGDRFADVQRRVHGSVFGKGAAEGRGE